MKKKKQNKGKKKNFVLVFFDLDAEWYLITPQTGHESIVCWIISNNITIIKEHISLLFRNEYEDYELNGLCNNNCHHSGGSTQYVYKTFFIIIL